MEAKFIRIGNSKGLRLSKTILDKYDLKDKVELVLASRGGSNLQNAGVNTNRNQGSNLSEYTVCPAIVGPGWVPLKCETPMINN